ncbi:hypothetical protein NHQ30_000698 [Ciborinia camelliae]|nr:hypothetical protein NHQ30_000698 [Ciborinia camelliae]
MQHSSHEDSFAYEMPTPEQIWASFPNEELPIGDNDSNNIANPAFDTGLASLQMLASNQLLSSEESFINHIDNTQFPELLANHWQMPTFDQPLQLPLNEGLFTGIDQMPTTHQSWQSPFNGVFLANEFEYPALSQSLYPAMGHLEGGEIGIEQPHVSALSANTTLIPVQSPINPPSHPNTGRYPCSYPTCTQDFKRPGDRLRHITSVHQRGQASQGRNLCPIVGCRRSYGRGLCRPDKVNDHLRKIHGLVRTTQAGGSVAAGTSVNGAGSASGTSSGTAGFSANANGN